LNAVVFAESAAKSQHLLRVHDYDLAATLDSGQAFRWRCSDGAWTGIIGDKWVQLTRTQQGIEARTASAIADWQWLSDYLQVEVDLDAILSQLPDEPLLADAIRAHRGLRLLRQDPWECLASFILSSTKQIVHIKRIVEQLCGEYGQPLDTLDGHPAHTFPAPGRIASLTEPSLRALRMGFRAPYLLEAARRLDSGRLDLKALRAWPLPRARAALMELPGVGRKIADCVLLFALGFDDAFPVDVWVMRALRSAWFPNQQVTRSQLVSFSEKHFGSHGGYAQQYLFHHARMESLRTRTLHAHAN
jgi:N-glycosylase/DNA lyase